MALTNDAIARGDTGGARLVPVTEDSDPITTGFNQFSGHDNVPTHTENPSYDRHIEPISPKS